MMHSVFRQLLGPDHLNGLKDIFSGADVPKQNAYAILNWNTHQDHLNFMADKERQVPFAAQFADAQKADAGPDGLSMKHAVVQEDAVLDCLRAPLTEVAVVKVKAGATLGAVQAAVDKYVAYANKDSTPPVAAAYGQEVGKPQEELLLVIGWNSAEGQKAALQSDEVKSIIEEMALVGEFEARITSLRQVTAA